MSLSAPFIKRPVGTSLLAMGLFLVGVAAYKNMPVAPIPRVDFPIINVSASLPGADPGNRRRFRSRASGTAFGSNRWSF